MIIAIALYLRYDWYIKNYVHGLEAYLIWTGPYILIASCSMTILLTIVGSLALIQENLSLNLTVNNSISRLCSLGTFVIGAISSSQEAGRQLH